MYCIAGGGVAWQNFCGIMIICITKNFHWLNFHSKQVLIRKIESVPVDGVLTKQIMQKHVSIKPANAFL